VAVADSGRIIFVPGRLSWNGTEIGTCRGIRFQPNPRWAHLFNPRLGTIIDSVYTGESPVTISAIVRYPDTDAISAAAAKSAVGTAVHWLFRPGTGGTKPGTMGSSKAGTLLFTPKASANHPAVKLYNAIPQIADDAELRMSMEEEYGLGLKFTGTPDSNFRVYEAGLLSDLP